MSSRIFAPARVPGGGVEDVQSMAYVTSALIVKGTVLIFASGEVQVGGTNPTPIVGVALEDAATKPGWEPGHSSQVDVTTGRVQEVSVAIANATTIFSGAGSSDPAQANVGVEYGINVSSGVWTVDLTDTSTTRVNIVDIDTNENIFFFRFMTAHLAVA